MIEKKDANGTDEKMDIIIEYLHRMDRRERLRTVGGFFRGMIGLIPIILMVWSAWYVIVNGDDLLMKITEMAAKQAASMSQQGGSEIIEQFKLMFPNQ